MDGSKLLGTFNIRTWNIKTWNMRTWNIRTWNTEPNNMGHETGNMRTFEHEIMLKSWLIPPWGNQMVVSSLSSCESFLHINEIICHDLIVHEGECKYLPVT